MSKITLSGHIEVPADEIGKIKEALLEHTSKTKAENGCLVFEVTEDVNELGRFTVYEEFDSRKSFEMHQERVKESHWGAITKNVVRHYKIEGLEN